MANFSIRRTLLPFKLGLIIGLVIVLTGSIAALEYGDYQRIVSPDEEGEGYAGIGYATMSDDGNVILYQSYSLDGILSKAFLFNRQADTVEQLSIGYIDGVYNQPRLSATGRYLLYSPDEGLAQVRLLDLETDTQQIVSKSTSGYEASAPSHVIGISADGRYAAFYSSATNLVADMTGCNELLFVRDTLNNTTTCIPMGDGQTVTYDIDYWAALSGDGSKLYYGVKTTDCCYELYVYDLATQITTPIDVAFDDQPADDRLALDTVSHDGSVLVFTSYLANNIVPGTSGRQVMYIYDGTTGLISAWDAFEQELIAPPTEPETYYTVTPVAISDSGRYVWGRLVTQSPDNLQANKSASRYLSPTMAQPAEQDGEILFVNFVYDRETNLTTQILVTENTTALGHPTGIVDVTGDGEVVFLASNESSLVPDDTNGVTDIFLAFLQDETPEPTVTELLVNGNFDDNDDANTLLPDGWKKVGLLKNDRVRSNTLTQTYARSTPNAFQLQGMPDEVGKVSKLTRNAKISGVTFTAGDTLTFSAMVDQRSGIPGTPIVKALVKFNNGSQQVMTLKLPNPKISGYTSVSLSKTLKRGDVKSIKVDLFYSKGSGKLYIDDLSLTHTPAESAPMWIPVPAAPVN